MFARILRFFGHIARHDNLERLIIQRKPEGKRGRGRSPTRWTDLVARLTGSGPAKAARQASNRTLWRETVRSVIAGLDLAEEVTANSHHTSVTTLD